MEVILAKSAGFCFGVRRAVNEVYRCLEEEKDYTSHEKNHRQPISV